MPDTAPQITTEDVLLNLTHLGDAGDAASKSAMEAVNALRHLDVDLGYANDSDEVCNACGDYAAAVAALEAALRHLKGVRQVVSDLRCWRAQ
jgi:hypothetical protein